MTPELDPAALQLKARALLESYNLDADYFRRVAQEARRGRAPSFRDLAAVRRVQADVGELLDQIQTVLATTSVGHLDFRSLLWAQTATLSVSESIARSADAIEAYGADQPTSGRSLYWREQVDGAAALPHTVTSSRPATAHRGALEKGVQLLRALPQSVLRRRLATWQLPG